MMDSRQKSALYAWIALGAIGVLIGVLVSSALPAEAGDYWIYKTGEGDRNSKEKFLSPSTGERVWISNQKPPEGAVILRHYEMEEVSDEEVRAAAAREDSLRRERIFDERTQAIDRLAAEIARQQATGNRREAPEINIGLGVGGTSVEVRPTIVAPRKK